MSQMQWGHGFHINGNERYMLCDTDNETVFIDKSYFNDCTYRIIINKGNECDEYLSLLPDGKEYLFIQVGYVIKNYFGDKSGRHRRSKQFVYDGSIFYNDQGEPVKRLPREVRAAIEDYNRLINDNDK